MPYDTFDDPSAAMRARDLPQEDRSSEFTRFITETVRCFHGAMRAAEATDDNAQMWAELRAVQGGEIFDVLSEAGAEFDQKFILSCLALIAELETDLAKKNAATLLIELLHYRNALGVYSGEFTFVEESAKEN